MVVIFVVDFEGVDVFGFDWIVGIVVGWWFVLVGIVYVDDCCFVVFGVGSVDIWLFIWFVMNDDMWCCMVVGDVRYWNGIVCGRNGVCGGDVEWE